jgi:hypothetical protein
MAGIAQDIGSALINRATDTVSHAVEQAADKIANHLTSYLPSRTTIACMSTLGLVGLTLGSLPGAALGVGAGLAISMPANELVEVMHAGAGEVIQGIKSLAHHTVKLIKSTIYLSLDSIFGWLARWSDTSDWAKSINANVDELYLQKLADAKMDIRPLLIPLASGVAAQQDIIDTLAAQANDKDQSVTKEQITQWVALGERLTQALSSSAHNTRHQGSQIRVDSFKGPPILVESSLYTTRAIAWYATAQALWNASLRQAQMPQDNLSPLSMYTLATEILAISTLVLPDPGSKMFHFIQRAPSKYIDQTSVLNKQSQLTEALGKTDLPSMFLPALDDSSNRLPGKAGRVVINSLKAGQDGMPRIALQLQAQAYLLLTGQRSEGHESLSWNAMQMATGFPRKVMAAVESWNPNPLLQAQTIRQSRYDTIYKTLDQAIASLPLRSSNPTKADEETKLREQLTNQMKQRPLSSLLDLFTRKKNRSQAEKPASQLLNAIPDPQYSELRELIITTIHEDMLGGWDNELAREGDALPVLTHLKTVYEIQQDIALKQTEIAKDIASRQKATQTLREEITEKTGALKNTVVETLTAAPQKVNDGIKSGLQWVWAGATHFLPSMSDNAEKSTFADALREPNPTGKEYAVDQEEDSEDEVYYETAQSFDEDEADVEEDNDDEVYYETVQSFDEDEAGVEEDNDDKV